MLDCYKYGVYFGNEKTKDSISDDYEKPLFRRGWYIGFLFPGPGLSFALSILNAAKLQIELDRSTQGYLTDVTSQLSRDIRDAINNKITNLVMTADSFRSLQKNKIQIQCQGFLNRAAQIFEFKPLIFFDRGGLFLSPSPTDDGEPLYPRRTFLSFPVSGPLFRAAYKASYIGGKSIFIPSLSIRDNGVDGVLVGVRSKENMQSLISSKSFSGQMLSCIVDNQGQVIISPTDLKPFLQLGDIFKQEKMKNNYRHTEDAAGYDRKPQRRPEIYCYHKRRTAPLL